jgi:hypothetical protein
MGGPTLTAALPFLMVALKHLPNDTVHLPRRLVRRLTLKTVMPPQSGATAGYAPFSVKTSITCSG